MNIPAPGFDVSCHESLVAYDWEDGHSLEVFKVKIDSGEMYTGDALDSLGAQLGRARQMSTINTTALYKPTTGCQGSLVLRQCVLRTATVAYPVTRSSSFGAALGAWRLGDNETVRLVDFAAAEGSLYTTAATDTAESWRIMLAGVASVVRSAYEGSATRTASGLVEASGQSASDYLVSELSADGSCAMAWDDPTADVVGTIRELMFRSAVAHSLVLTTAASSSSASSPPPQQVLHAQETRMVASYESHFDYLGWAFSCMFLEVLAVVVLIGSWQLLGRNVSVDAFEVAKAFGAPLLADGGGSSNETVDGLLARVGARRVRYGEVADGAAAKMRRPVGPVWGSREDVPFDELSQAEGRDGGSVVDSEMVSLLNDESVIVEDDRLGKKPRLEFRPEDQVQDIRTGVLY